MRVRRAAIFTATLAASGYVGWLLGGLIEGVIAWVV